VAGACRSWRGRGGPGRRGYAGDGSAQCQEQVLAELEQHGLPRPAPDALVFRIRDQDPEEAERAIAADYLRRRDAPRASPYDAWWNSHVSARFVRHEGRELAANPCGAATVVMTAMLRGQLRDLGNGTA